MTTASVTAKEFSSRHNDRIIRVQVGDQEGNGFHALTFPESEIQGVAEMGKDRSALVLHALPDVPVALPYEQLEQKIYEPLFKIDGPVLDLRAVTGPAAEAANANQPAKTKAANANEAPAEPRVGDKMPDGTVFAGISPDTHKPMYATPADASLTLTFNDAQEYAAKLDAHGYKDWHVPTKNELNVLFNNSAMIGGFNLMDTDLGGWYWSSSQYSKGIAWSQRLSNGLQLNINKDYSSAVRLVRTEAPKTTLTIGTKP